MEAAPGRWPPRARVSWRQTVGGHRSEHARFLGAQEPGAARLVADRCPASVVQERRRIATKQAQQNGSTPLHAPLPRLAWHLWSTQGPRTLWKTDPVGKAEPSRGHGERMVQAWKSARHGASIKTPKAATTFGEL